MSHTLPAVSLMQVKLEESKDSWARFIIEPLSPGFGLTVANALRRVLLSSLEGSAITSIRIDGVSHEFTTVKGVRQDVVDLILNLKQVRLTTESAEPQVIILDAKGEGQVKAGDFKCPTGVKIANKDLVIADMVAGGKLLIEATVETGRGYVPTEQRRDDKLPIGVIAIDAAFSPVSLVNFEVENTRVGNMTNFDRLILEITTDGTIEPQSALEQSAAILVDHFSVIAGSTTSTNVETSEGVEMADSGTAAESTNPARASRSAKTSKAKSA